MKNKNNYKEIYITKLIFWHKAFTRGVRLNARCLKATIQLY